MEKSKMMNQSDFERLSQLMADKGVVHEAFELLADLRQSERVAKQELVAITDAIVVALAGVTDCEGLKNEYVDWLEAKATAYDRLMSGGKKTLKGWANFLGKPVAVDNGVTVWAYDKVPELSGNLWVPIAGSRMYQLPRSLVNFSGDWQDSLTLPDGWEEK